MDNDRWDDIVGRIKDTFTIEEEFHEPLESGPGTREGVIYSGPQGRMKLERVTKPRVIGSHGVASKRIGAHATVAYEYDERDQVSSVHLFQWRDAAWVPAEENGNLS